MPYDEGLASRVRAALGRSCPVQEKTMFGGVTFMVRGKMCVSMSKDRLMRRIDPAIHDEAIQSPRLPDRGHEGAGLSRLCARECRSREDQVRP